jgi:membrane-associated HD superfamily phosphohydrolase
VETLERPKLARLVVFCIILVDFLLEFLYLGARFLGIQLWLAPIDLSSVEGQISWGLYIFEAVLTAQFFLIWVVAWRKKWVLKVDRKRQVAIIATLAVALLVVLILVFTWDATWPGMLYRRLFAFESWILITMLSVFVQVSWLNVPLER